MSIAKSALVPSLTVLSLSIVAVGFVTRSTEAQSGTRPPQAKKPAGFALVELFTSEGCSSCPPADRLLASIDKWGEENNQRVLALSFHVDYWNQLGWEDPYSSSAHTQRQRAYASARGERSVYTPQMIVNGGEGFVGSDSKRATQALSEALTSTPTAELEIASARREGDRIHVHYTVRGTAAGAVLNLALIDKQGSQSVPRGENAGRTLRHVNIVRAFHSTPIAGEGAGNASFALPAQAPAGRLIAYVQQPTTLSVVAAAEAEL